MQKEGTLISSEWSVSPGTSHGLYGHHGGGLLLSCGDESPSSLLSFSDTTQGGVLEYLAKVAVEAPTRILLVGVEVEPHFSLLCLVGAKHDCLSIFCLARLPLFLVLCLERAGFC